MFKAQQVTGPVAPGQMSPMQVSGRGLLSHADRRTHFRHVQRHDAHDHDDHDDGDADADDEGRHRAQPRNK